MSDRLTQADWIRSGLRTLARDGAGALKVGAMATALKVSRGSFYWHFKDIADFKAQVLQSWADQTTDQVRRDLDAQTPDSDRLKQLMRRALGARRTTDRAVRAWAAADQTVAAVVAEVDAKRVAYLSELLAAAGVEPGQAARRAAFLYWALLGQAFVMDPAQTAMAAAGMDDIGALFEG